MLVVPRSRAKYQALYHIVDLCPPICIGLDGANSAAAGADAVIAVQAFICSVYDRTDRLTSGEVAPGQSSRSRETKVFPSDPVGDGEPARSRDE